MKSYLLVLLFLVSGFNAAAERTWEETGIRFSHFENVIQERCLLNARSFNACLYTFETIHEILSENLNLYVPDTAQERLNLVNLGTKASEQALAEKEKIQKVRKTQLEKIFQTVKSAHPQFFHEQISQLQKTFPELMGPKEADFAAANINLYLSKSYDPFTQLINPEIFLDQMKNVDKTYKGIGSRIREAKGKFWLFPFDGSPAEQAGVKVGDELLEINDETVFGLTAEGVASRLKSSETDQSPTVNITVLRKEQKHTLTITRGEVNLKNVTAKLLDNGAVQTGYIRLASFSMRQKNYLTAPEDCLEIHRAIIDFSKSGVDGFILDLRDNGGGSVNNAKCVADLFTKINQPGLAFANSKGYLLKEWYTDNPMYTGLPLVILVNANSASASEIVAGIIQDHEANYPNHLVMGKRSFGKGTVQAIANSRSHAFKKILGDAFEDAKVELKFTEYRYAILPSERLVHGVGIIPDIEVNMSPDGPTEVERVYKRLSDLYPELLEDQDLSWAQPRPDFVSTIETCMKTEGSAAKIYRERALESGSDTFLDFQLFSAQDAIGCLKIHAENTDLTRQDVVPIGDQVLRRQDLIKKGIIKP